MNERIEEGRQVIKDCKARFDAVVLEVQAACVHSTVAEFPWGHGCAPKRICAQCGLEEEGTHHSGGEYWQRRDYKLSELANKDARRVKVVQWTEFYGYRP